MAEQKGKIENYIDKKNITSKKLIKATTLLMGLVLIIFSTLANVIFDPSKLDWIKWLTNSLIILGIMIFGLFMGESISKDKQQENPKMLYQTNLREYNDLREKLEPIVLFFAQFYLWFKEKELRTKKINFLIDNQFDGQWARAIVDNCEKIDLDNLISKGEHDKVYIKGDKPIKKVSSEEEIEILKEMFDLKLNAPAYAYFLTAFGTTSSKSVLETGTYLENKIKSDKRFNRILKITSSLFISLIIGMATVKDFQEGEQLAAWLNLVSRLTAFTTSFISGWSSSVITVKTESQILKNKTNVLSDFKNALDSKLFVAEKYEEQVERLLKEQKTYEEQHKCEIEVVDKPKILEISHQTNEISNENKKND